MGASLGAPPWFSLATLWSVLLAGAIFQVSLARAALRGQEAVLTARLSGRGTLSGNIGRSSDSCIITPHPQTADFQLTKDRDTFQAGLSGRLGNCLVTVSAAEGVLAPHN